MTKATTQDIGFAIRDFLEGMNISHFTEVFTEVWGELQETPLANTIEFIDCGDPNNLKVCLANGQFFTVRIFAE